MLAVTFLPAEKFQAFLDTMQILDVQNAIKKFTTSSFGNTDYSGFDRENWTPRTAALHRQNCASVLQETTKTNIRKKEADCGARYSILLF